MPSLSTGFFFFSSDVHTSVHVRAHVYIASSNLSCRELICTTLKCISIKEKHIEVPGEEREERCERRKRKRGGGEIDSV